MRSKRMKERVLVEECDQRQSARVLEFSRMQTDLVFDVGAHYGNDTAYYLSRGFRVVAVEAHPKCFCELYQRFSESIAAGKLHILNFAVAERHGLCTLLD